MEEQNLSVFGVQKEVSYTHRTNADYFYFIFLIKMEREKKKKKKNFHGTNWTKGETHETSSRTACTQSPLTVEKP